MARADLNRAISRRAILLVTSPLSGIAETISVQPGEWADPAIMAVEIIDPDRLVVAASVAPEDLSFIQMGQPAMIELSAGPSTMPIAERSSLSSSVVLIDSRLDAKTGQGSVDVAVPPHAGLRPGQFARIRIVTKEKVCLTVPAESIVHNASGHPAVAAVEIDGRYAALLPVDVGIREGDLVEVSGEGLHEGQSVATTGSYALLLNKTPVRVVGH
jgi:membrane fusion protein, multidrug efflux system